MATGQRAKLVSRFVEANFKGLRYSTGLWTAPMAYKYIAYIVKPTAAARAAALAPLYMPGLL